MGATFYPKPPSDEATILDGATVSVTDYADTAIDGCIAVVESNNLTVVAPTDTAFVTDTQALEVGGSTYTFTVVGGVITAIVVS